MIPDTIWVNLKMPVFVETKPGDFEYTRMGVWRLMTRPTRAILTGWMPWAINFLTNWPDGATVAIAFKTKGRMDYYDPNEVKIRIQNAISRRVWINKLGAIDVGESEPVKGFIEIIGDLTWLT